MSDRDRRELERRAAAGDQDAAARLRAWQLRAPADEEEVEIAESAGRQRAVEDAAQATFEAWRAAGTPDISGAGAGDTLLAYQQARRAMHGPRTAAYGSDPCWVMRSSDAVARAILDAYREVTGSEWGKRKTRLTGPQAERVLRAYYRELGYRGDTISGDNVMVSADQMNRVVFNRTSVRHETGGRGRWRRRRREHELVVSKIGEAERLLRGAARRFDWRANPGEDERQRRLARQAAAGDAEAAARLRAAQARSGTGGTVRLGDLVFGPRMLGLYPEQSRSVRGWSPYGTTPFAIGRRRAEEALYEVFVLPMDYHDMNGVFSIAEPSASRPGYRTISYKGWSHEVDALSNHLTSAGADDGGWIDVDPDYPNVETLFLQDVRVPQHVADQIEAEWLRYWPPCPATSQDRNLACDRVVGHPGPHEYA